MACAALASSGSSQVANPNSGCEEDQLRAVINHRKLRRMQSNRESARRSRMRKQKHMDDLVAQVSQLRKEKSQILAALNVTVEQYLGAEAENCVLRAQVAELSARLRLLGEMSKYCYCLSEAYMDGSACEEEGFLSSDCFVMSRPWSLMAVNQVAVAEMLQEYPAI